MKITLISKLFFAFAICLSLVSFSHAADKKAKKEKAGKSLAFDAAIFQILNSNKVKLAVDRGDSQNLRVTLKNKSGQIFYTESFADAGEKYRRVFDLEDMTDGTYYFEMYYNKQKLVKEIKINTSTARQISL